MKDNQSFEIKAIKMNAHKTVFDIFVNQQQLSKKLGIDRFDMAYCDFDLDTFEVDTTKFPDYNRKQINTNAVSQFLGDSDPTNQFGTDRIVLYRCHCGSDYCGVISFRLEKQGDVILWKDIRYEIDGLSSSDEPENTEVKPLKELKFDARVYHLEFEKYLKEIK